MERKGFLIWFGFLFALVVLAGAQENPEQVRVLVLGAYHFGNSGQDLHNMKVDHVRTPAKQAELEDLATRLVRFNPNKIAVEAVADRPDLTTSKFDDFTAETLMKNPDERRQIAFRLAQKLAQKSVYGIDEQSDKIDYFPFDKVDEYAKAHGAKSVLEKMHAEVEAMLKKDEAAQKTTPVREMLARVNDPKRIDAEHAGFYYALLKLGDTKIQPGADLNGAWYLRNAKIFAKLTQTAKPGDRIMVMFGSGHCYWLRHFVRNTPGFVLVEPNDYLR